MIDIILELALLLGSGTVHLGPSEPMRQFQLHCRPWAARSNNLMKQQLLTFDFVFWYVTIICQMVACWALIRRKQFFQHWKVFGYYLFYSTGVAMFMLAMALFASNRAFATAYSILDFVEAIFLNLVLLEILVKVLDPLNLFLAAPWQSFVSGQCSAFPPP